jgi:NAD(P)-dependent dehydrogenase (short-subunit alcohol dehydrogenase family)
MKHVVITGGTRGIGLGLARSFLDLGCRVTLCGRSAASVEAAVAELDHALIAGHACDVTSVDEVQALWDFASDLAPVDVWINNAGMANPRGPLVGLQPGDFERVIRTNIVGVYNGSVVAARGMAAQGHGWIWNMEGLGSDGRMVDGLVPYGSTKRALRYLTRGLVSELRDGPVRVGFLSPGMVLTDMLLKEAREAPDWEQMKKVFNILADRTETVTPWLARRILDARAHGARVAWLNGAKIAGRFMLAPLRRRNIVE